MISYGSKKRSSCGNFYRAGSEGIQGFLKVLCIEIDVFCDKRNILLNVHGTFLIAKLICESSFIYLKGLTITAGTNFFAKRLHAKFLESNSNNWTTCDLKNKCLKLA